MLRIHKEGFLIIGGTFCVLAVINGLVMWLAHPYVLGFTLFASLIFFGLVVQFFRNPKREIPLSDNKLVYAPADGKIVVIEETNEDEYFHDRRIQVSIFMSPLNVHVNRNPISGVVKYFRYHEGKYLVAWHPKSSTENERTTTVIDSGKHQVLFRQIAGAVARRIIAYVKEGDTVWQGKDMGFIRFGSRVDVFLPLDAEILVKIDEVSKGNQTVLARLK
ncbi:MAG: phosphatidylserine decarboxylase family protein [Saprospiraceae bacterium]|nr:phosphatidylserine decarboxylase family protein [Saprospiraceae bacterium]